MDTRVLIGIVVALVAVGLVAWFWWQARSRHILKARFGPEYERAIREYGNESKAVSALGKREKRISNYKIRPLTNRELQEFESSWRKIQALFVDDPRGAVREADALVCRVMETRSPTGCRLLSRAVC